MAEFTKFTEEALIGLSLEFPDFFHRIARFLEPKYFTSEECQFVINEIKDYYNKYDAVPTKEVLIDKIITELKVDDEITEPILKLINTQIDPRNTPYIKENIIDWAKKKQIAMLYDEDVIEQAKAGDFTKIMEIVEETTKITDTVIKPFDFFNDFESLFLIEEKEYCTTGFPRLDVNFNDKGPARGEVYLWVAPTGVGKSIMLVNTGTANLLKGKKVLHISLENSTQITANRYMGCLSLEVIKTRMQHKDVIVSKIEQLKTLYNHNLQLLYFPTDSISITEIALAMQELKRQLNFVPDVLIIDYLECLLSRRPDMNRDDYKRQKSVSSELRALASQTNVHLFSASQTNRSGSNAADEGTNINLDKLAESFGKAMPVDYVVSINQSQSDYTQANGSNTSNQSPSLIGRVRLFIAKNRNGPKFITVNAEINYANMKSKEEGS